jgi:hypothetical protein
MPLDGTHFEKSLPTGPSFLAVRPIQSPSRPSRADPAVVALLERAILRATTRYTWSSLYRPPNLFHSSPGFCMAGALTRTDNGGWEDGSHVRHAEALVRQAIHGRDLMEYGTWPFARRFVIRAFKRALTLANA